MKRKLIALALVASLALAGCIGGSDEAPSQSDDASTDQAEDGTADEATQAGNTSSDRMEDGAETETRQLVDESFSLVGPQASQSFDFTLPNGSKGVVARLPVDTQASAGFSFSVFEDCSDGAAAAVVASAQGETIVVGGSNVYEGDCGSPDSGDYSLTVSHDAGVSQGSVNVTATVPIEA